MKMPEDVEAEEVIAWTVTLAAKPNQRSKLHPVTKAPPQSSAGHRPHWRCYILAYAGPIIGATSVWQWCVAVRLP